MIFSGGIYLHCYATDAQGTYEFDGAMESGNGYVYRAEREGMFKMQGWVAAVL